MNVPHDVVSGRMTNGIILMNSWVITEKILLPKKRRQDVDMSESWICAGDNWLSFNHNFILYSRQELGCDVRTLFYGLLCVISYTSFIEYIAYGIVLCNGMACRMLPCTVCVFEHVC